MIMQIIPLINSLQSNRYFFAFFKRETVKRSEKQSSGARDTRLHLSCVYALAFARLKHEKK